MQPLPPWLQTLLKCCLVFLADDPLSVDHGNFPCHFPHSKPVFDAGIPLSTQSGSSSSSLQLSASPRLRAWSWKDSPRTQGAKITTTK